KKIESKFYLSGDTEQDIGLMTSYGMKPEIAQMILRPMNEAQRNTTYDIMSTQTSGGVYKYSDADLKLLTMGKDEIIKQRLMAENGSGQQKDIAVSNEQRRQELERAREKELGKASKQTGKFNALAQKGITGSPGQQRIIQNNLFKKLLKSGYIDSSLTPRQNAERLSSLNMNSATVSFLYPNQTGGMLAMNKSHGGIIYASEGQLINFQPKGTDTVPAMLTPGEFVVNAKSTAQHLPLLKSINKQKGGKIGYYETGGSVDQKQPLGLGAYNAGQGPYSTNTPSPITNFDNEQFAGQFNEAGLQAESFGYGLAKSIIPTLAGIGVGAATSLSGPGAFVAGAGAGIATAKAQENYLDLLMPKFSKHMNDRMNERPFASIGGSLIGGGLTRAGGNIRRIPELLEGTVTTRAASAVVGGGMSAGMSSLDGEFSREDRNMMLREALMSGAIPGMIRSSNTLGALTTDRSRKARVGKDSLDNLTTDPTARGLRQTGVDSLGDQLTGNNNVKGLRLASLSDDTTGTRQVLGTGDFLTDQLNQNGIISKTLRYLQNILGFGKKQKDIWPSQPEFATRQPGSTSESILQKLYNDGIRNKSGMLLSEDILHLKYVDEYLKTNGIDPNSLKYLGEGMENLVFKTNDESVFKIGLGTPPNVKKILGLEDLKPFELPQNIPGVTGYGSPTQSGPYHFALQKQVQTLTHGEKSRYKKNDVATEIEQALAKQGYEWRDNHSGNVGRASEGQPGIPTSIGPLTIIDGSVRRIPPVKKSGIIENEMRQEAMPKASLENIPLHNPDQIVYHGSGASFDKIDMSKSPGGMLGAGFYAGFDRHDKGLAANYAIMGIDSHFRKNKSMDNFGGGIYPTRIKGGISDFAEARAPLSNNKKHQEAIQKIFEREKLAAQSKRFTGKYDSEANQIFETTDIDFNKLTFEDALDIITQRLSTKIEENIIKESTSPRNPYPFLGDTRSQSLRLAGQKARELMVEHGIPGSKDMGGELLGSPMISAYDPSRIHIDKPFIPEYLQSVLQYKIKQPKYVPIPGSPGLEMLESINKSSGGMIYASKGQLINYQSRGTDTIPAMLTPGEFVVNAKATQSHLPLLQAVNKQKGGRIGYYDAGGSVESSLLRDKQLATSTSNRQEQSINAIFNKTNSIDQKTSSIDNTSSIVEQIIKQNTDSANQNFSTLQNTANKTLASSENTRSGLQKTGYFSSGGVVYAANGMMIPYQPRGTDTVPAMLTPGEFVVNRSATQANLPLLQSLNNGAGSYMATGGRVSYMASGGLLGQIIGPMSTSFVLLTTSIKQSVKALQDYQKQLASTQPNSVSTNSGSGQLSGLDGLGQFVVKFDQFITAVNSINLPPVISLQVAPIQVNITGAEALTQALQGPMGEMLSKQISTAFGRLSAATEGALQVG
ncbi:MAG: hypothetical protein WD512_05090, partial [Candidatus Paceibacterota bacterium]